MADSPTTNGSDHRQLQIAIYQIAADDLFKPNRTDGTGWDWCWADWRRAWMEDTPSKFAYRCLPLTIANQTGWWVHNPIGFTAYWSGRTGRGQVEFKFDRNSEVWSQFINDQFGHGIVTWNTPFLFRTKPSGSRLIVCGPTNSFKHGIQPLTAIIESDWMTMSFTMNWKFTASSVVVRFEAGEPLFQVIPVVGNVCKDLQESQVTYQKLSDDRETYQAYNDWHHARKKFYQELTAGNVSPDDWQKDYFLGRGISDQQSAAEHITRIVPPKIRQKNSGGNGTS